MPRNFRFADETPFSTTHFPFCVCAILQLQCATAIVLTMPLCYFNVISICLINKIQSWSQLFNKYPHLLLFRFSSSTFRVPRSQGSIFQTMSNVIDLTEEPHILYPHTRDLTGSHVIINGTIIILDTVLMIKEHSQKMVDLDTKAKRNQKNAALRDKNRLHKIIEQENNAKCLHNSQLARDKHTAVDIDIYHNCEKSD